MTEADDKDSEDELADVKYGWHFDMLNDAERCDSFHRAVAAAVQQTQRERGKGKGVNVLDVGTGSGLLGLLAVKAGADNVVAVEADPVLAAVATRNVQANGFDQSSKQVGKMTVLGATSTSLRRSDLPGCAEGVDLCVSEVLDSGLIGEDCLSTMRHARHHLARKGGVCRFVPEGATVWGQLVQCKTMWSWQHLGGDHCSSGGGSLHGSVKLPAPALLGNGDGNPHDACADALYECGMLKPLSAPFKVFDFDFGDVPPSAGRQRRVTVAASATGSAHAVLFWWDCTLFSGAGENAAVVKLDTMPAFLQSSETPKAKIGTRSHWRQAACILPAPVRTVMTGEHIPLLAAHNDEDIWFRWSGQNENTIVAPPAKKRRRSTRASNSKTAEEVVAPQFPLASDAGELGAALHAACCPERMEALGSRARHKMMAEATSKAVAQALAALAAEKATKTMKATDDGSAEKSQGLCVLDAGDGSLMAILAAKALSVQGTGPDEAMVISLETKEPSATLWQAIAEANVSSSSHVPVSVRLQPSEEQGEEEEEEEEKEVEEEEEEGGQDTNGDTLGDVERVHLLVAEPFFAESADVWAGHTLVRLWSRCAELSPSLGFGAQGAPGSWRALLCPCRGRVMACVIECAELWHQRRRLGPCVEGLDLTAMNSLNSDSAEAVFSLPMACHRHRTLSAPFELLAVDLSKAAAAAAVAEGDEGSSASPLPSALTNLASVTCDTSGTAHALALWVEYTMVESTDGARDAPSLVHSTGAPSDASDGRQFTAAHSRASYQGVRFNFKSNDKGQEADMIPSEASAVLAGVSKCMASIVFDTERGVFMVDFRIQHQNNDGRGKVTARKRKKRKKTQMQ